MSRHLSEILTEQQTKITDLGADGTYIAVKFSRETQNNLSKLAEALGIAKDERVSREKMHCTIVYSRKPFTNFTIHGKMKDPWKATPTDLEIFPTQSGSRALVLRFDCKEMVERHEYFKKEYGATYDFDEYKPHATLCYNVGPDWQIPEKFDIKSYIPELEVSEEYYEPLNNDWANTASDEKKKKGE